MSPDREPDKQTYPAQEQLVAKLRALKPLFPIDCLAVPDSQREGCAHGWNAMVREVEIILSEYDRHRASTELAKTPTCEHGKESEHWFQCSEKGCKDVHQCLGPGSKTLESTPQHADTTRTAAGLSSASLVSGTAQPSRPAEAPSEPGTTSTLQEQWKMTPEQTTAVSDEMLRYAGRIGKSVAWGADYVEAAVRLGIVVPAGACVQVPPVSREQIEQAVSRAWNDGPFAITDALEALLPRSVQAQLTDEEIEILSNLIDEAIGGCDRNEGHGCGHCSELAEIDAVLALLARAARGQDGEQQP